VLVEKVRWMHEEHFHARRGVDRAV
jgi:hypothetical protein